jgi:hypothetical protein
MTTKFKIKSPPTILPSPPTILNPRRLAAAAKKGAERSAALAGRAIAGTISAAGSSVVGIGHMAAAAKQGAERSAALAGRAIAGTISTAGSSVVAIGHMAAAAKQGAEHSAAVAGRAIAGAIVEIGQVGQGRADQREQAKLDQYVSALSAVPREKLIAALPALLVEIERQRQARGKFAKRDLDIYDQVVAPVLAEERRDYPSDTGLLSHGRVSENIPLDDPNELANWLNARSQTDKRTLSTGQRLLEKFGRKFKETICGKGGPYELFHKTGLQDNPVVSYITKGIIGTSFVCASLWAFAAVLAWAIVKTGLKVYCEPD